MICILKSTLMAGVSAQLLSAVSDEKNYRTMRLRLVVLCFCYASLCLNLVAPIGTIFLTIRFGSMPAEQVECLTRWFDHPKVGRSQLKYLSPSLWLRQSLGFGTFTLVFSCKFPLIEELSDVSHFQGLFSFYFGIGSMLCSVIIFTIANSQLPLILGLIISGISVIPYFLMFISFFFLSS